MNDRVGMTDTLKGWPAGKELHRSIEERIAALTDEQIVVERCASCPEFMIEGPFVTVRESFRAHVAECHPELLPALARSRMPRKIMPSKEPEFALLSRLDQLARVAA